MNLRKPKPTWRRRVDNFLIWAHNLFKVCYYCRWRRPVWQYIDSCPACDECVPRGCSCNLEPPNGNWEAGENLWIQPKDEQGREYPCVEWSKY